MDPLPTLDHLLANTPTDTRPLAAAAAAAVAAALSDRAAIEAFDKAAHATDWVDGPRSLAAVVRVQWEAWHVAATALRQRVELVAARLGPVAGSEDLRHAIGRTSARLAATIDDLAAAVRDGQEGREHRFASVEEMRRELLRPNVSRHGQGAVSAARPAAAGSGT